MGTIAKLPLKILVVFGISSAALSSCGDEEPATSIAEKDSAVTLWRGWTHYSIKPGDTLEKYGYELIANTAAYLGPKGTVATISNGMNCQNCHVEGGTIPWGNNYSAVVSTYPKVRARSGQIETVAKRVNDCFERSLNGKALDTNSREMKAIIAYMHWVGDEIPKGESPAGSGIIDLPYLDRAADPVKGKSVYMASCQTCHGANGEGQPKPDGSGYVYPPMWGPNSYNDGAGLYRLSRFAGFVKANMPFLQATYDHPKLTDAEAWDVAAFVNSQPRPKKDISQDWPDISKKPIDHPFGPFSDGFGEAQHKFGPFKPIKEARDAAKKTASR